MNRVKIKGRAQVANQVLPSQFQLGAAPYEADAVDLDHLIADAKVGVSGAGKVRRALLFWAG